MKMKTYKEFLNEVHVISKEYFGNSDFEFSIYVGDVTDKEINDFMKSLEKYFDYEDCHRIKDYFMKYGNVVYFKFLVWESIGNAGFRRNSIKFNVVYKPSIYNFTISEFLELGFEGIGERIEDEKMANKYNL